MANVGLKVFPDSEQFFKKVKEHIDFIEIMAVKKAQYRWLEDWGKPVVIHHEHSRFGINHANPEKRRSNLQSTQWAQFLATKFRSQKIIVHPGYVENGKCQLAEVVHQLAPLKDKRIIVENLIYVATKYYMFAYNWHQLQYLCKKLNTGVCLDVSHGVISATELTLDPKKYLKELGTLPTKHIHVCDGEVNSPDDMHLHIGDGNFPLKQYLKQFPKKIDVTLETGNDPKKAIRDVAFIRKNYR